VTVTSRGRVLVKEGRLLAEPGSGRFLARGGGEAARPTGRLSPEMDRARNFGAELL
jgi:dihydropyrimidinase